MIVAKFGGTSVSTKERILTIGKIVRNTLDSKPVIVVSALSGVTDLLLSISISPYSKTEEIIQKINVLHRNLAEELFRDSVVRENVFSYIDNRLNEVRNIARKGNFDKASLDKLASNGEILSSFIIANALKNMGIEAEQVIATELIVTDDNFGSAEFIEDTTKRNTKNFLLPMIKKGIVPVVTGFIGKTVSGKTTTLGRGGSDYSASIIGFCLDAKEIQIWTDVDGIHSADPRLVENTKILKTVSYREASELATFGAKVLHPRTIRPAVKNGIPVHILNSFNIKSLGSLIMDSPEYSNPITAISSKNKITLVNIYSTDMLLQKGFLARVFQIFANKNISIDLVSVSEVSVSLTLDNDEHLDEVLAELSKFASVTTTKKLGIVSLVGEGIVTSSSIIKLVFDILDKEKILVKMVSLGATNINVSLVIQQDQIEHAVKVLHNQLLLKLFNNQYNGSQRISNFAVGGIN
jgi:aspartate kinase